MEVGGFPITKSILKDARLCAQLHAVALPSHLWAGLEIGNTAQATVWEACD